MKNIRFCDIEVGDIFTFIKDGISIECEKLSNNLVEDDKGYTFYLASSDKIELLTVVYDK